MTFISKNLVLVRNSLPVCSEQVPLSLWFIESILITTSTLTIALRLFLKFDTCFLSTKFVLYQ